jgi:hypothetical protein
MQEEDPKRDAGLAVLAGKQHGTVAYWQLRRLGFTKGAVEYWGRNGRLHRMYKGVYSVGYPHNDGGGVAHGCGPGLW